MKGGTFTRAMTRSRGQLKWYAQRASRAETSKSKYCCKNITLFFWRKIKWIYFNIEVGFSTKAIKWHVWSSKLFAWQK